MCFISFVAGSGQLVLLTKAVHFVCVSVCLFVCGQETEASLAERSSLTERVVRTVLSDLLCEKDLGIDHMTLFPLPALHLTIGRMLLIARAAKGRMQCVAEQSLQSHSSNIVHY